jgi:hypothetical protein
MFEDVLDGIDGAAVGWSFAEGSQGVRERVWLELETDLDDVEGCNYESGNWRSALDGCFSYNMM